MNIFNLGPLELAVIAIVALLVVGPRQLPELGRMVGRWMKTFREASDEMKRSLYIEDDFRRQPPPKPRPSLQHDPAEEDEPGYLTDQGSNQGKYDAEDLDPDQERNQTEEYLSPDSANTKEEGESEESSHESTPSSYLRSGTDPSQAGDKTEETVEEAKRSYEEIDYDREGAD